MASDKTQPVKKFQAGGISSAVWKNGLRNADGTSRTVNSVTLDRRYKGSDGQWQSSNSFHVNDLPKAQLVLAQAYEYLVTNSGAEESANGGDEE